MINFLSIWVKNLALALIIVSILEMILPNNKTKKYVKMIMGLYVLFSIISPFIENGSKFNLDSINFDTYDENIQTSSYVDEKIDQTSMDKRLNKMYEEQLEKSICEDLLTNGYEVDKCNVTAHVSKSDSGIEKIVLRVKGKVEGNRIKEDTIENKIVTEIQKIQKVDIKVSENDYEDNSNNDMDYSQEVCNITKTDIKIITDFLINEYGVNDKCLKIN